MSKIVSSRKSTSWSKRAEISPYMRSCKKPCTWIKSSAKSCVLVAPHFSWLGNAPRTPPTKASGFPRGLMSTSPRTYCIGTQKSGKIRWISTLIISLQRRRASETRTHISRLEQARANVLVCDLPCWRSNKDCWKSCSDSSLNALQKPCLLLSIGLCY